MKVYSTNDEDFNYTEVSDLLNDFPDLGVGDTIFEAEAKKPSPLDLVNVDDIYFIVLESIIDRAYDIGGEYSEGWCYDLKHNKELKKKLEQSLKRWAKNLPEINFYSVGKSSKYILTEKDLEDV